MNTPVVNKPHTPLWTIPAWVCPTLHNNDLRYECNLEHPKWSVYVYLQDKIYGKPLDLTT